MRQYRNNELVLAKFDLGIKGTIGKISCMTGKHAEVVACEIRLSLYRKFPQLALHPHNRRARLKMMKENHVVAEISENGVLIRWPRGHIRRIKMPCKMDLMAVHEKEECL